MFIRHRKTRRHLPLYISCMHRAFKSSCLERLECLEYLGQSKRTDYSRLTIRTQTNVTQEKKTWAARLLDSEVDKFNSGPTIDSNSNYETRETWQELKPTWHSLNRENRNTKKRRKPKKKKNGKEKGFHRIFRCMVSCVCTLSQRT